MSEIYTVDELRHWGLSNGKHKYIAKIGVGPLAKYFYTQAQLDAYKQSLLGRIQNTAQQIRSAVSNPIRNRTSNAQALRQKFEADWARRNKQLKAKEKAQKKATPKIKKAVVAPPQSPTDTSGKGSGKGSGGKGKGSGGKGSTTPAETSFGNSSSNKGKRTPGSSGMSSAGGRLGSMGSSGGRSSMAKVSQDSQNGRMSSIGSMDMRYWGDERSRRLARAARINVRHMR